jgi:hypothetical protein
MYDELSEHILDATFDIDFEAPEIGKGGTYTSELRRPDGTPVGTVHGEYRVMMTRPSDGALMTHTLERIEFKDGEVRVDGWSTWENVYPGDTLYHPVVGISGAYLGLHGFREWRPVDPGKVAFARLGFFTNPMR